MRGFGSALALALAFAAPVAAGEGVWTPVGGPVTPSARLVVDPADPQTIYALVTLSTQERARALWKSTNGGETWRSIQEGIGGPIELLAIDPLRSERLYAWQFLDYLYNPQPRLWVSEDGGESWRVRFTLSDSASFNHFWQIVPSPLQEGVLFAWTDGSESNAAIYRSVDGGATWHRRGEVSRLRSSVESLSHHPARHRLEFFGGDAFYVSHDNGLTWSVRGTFHDEGFQRVVRSLAAPDRLYALPYVTDTCLVRSDDGGARWRKLLRPAFPRDVACVDVVVDPHDPDLVRVLASGQVGPHSVVLFSTSQDGGATWSRPQPLPAAGMVATAWTGIASGDLRRGLVALPGPGQEPILVANPTFPASLFGGLTRSVDGGATWTEVAKPNSPYGSLDADAGGRILYALRPRANRVERSSDGGLTWRDAPRPPAILSVLVADPYRPGRVFASVFDDEGVPSRASLWRTLDGAATWSRRSSGLPVDCVHFDAVDYCPVPYALTSDPRGSDRVLLAFGGAHVLSADVPVYVSTDGGTRWHRAAKSPSDEVFALAADPGTPGAFLAGTRAGIFRSEDGGEHWSAFGEGLPVESLVYQLLRDDRSGAWYAVTDSRGVFRSTDGGLSWSATGPGLPDLNFPLACLDPETPDHLFLAVRDQGLWSWSAPAR